jgi:hypothetical protein
MVQGWAMPCCPKVCDSWRFVAFVWRRLLDRRKSKKNWTDDQPPLLVMLFAMIFYSGKDSAMNLSIFVLREIVYTAQAL